MLRNVKGWIKVVRLTGQFMGYVAGERYNDNEDYEHWDCARSTTRELATLFEYVADAAPSSLRKVPTYMRGVEVVSDALGLDYCE